MYRFWVGPQGFRFLSPKTLTTRATSLMMSWSFSSSMKWVAPSNKLSWKKARFLFLCRDDEKKRNHPCFSLMQPHTIFNMKMQCNVFLPHVLLTRRQFQRLKYSVCPSVYTDNLIFTGKNWLIIMTCCLYCRTSRRRRTNHLRRLVRLSLNTAIFQLWVSNSEWNLLFYQVELVTRKKRISIKLFELVTRSVPSFCVTWSCNSRILNLAYLDFY